MEIFVPLDTIRSDGKLENNTECTQLLGKCQHFQEKHKTPQLVNINYSLITKLLRKFFKTQKLVLHYKSVLFGFLIQWYFS